MPSVISVGLLIWSHYFTFSLNEDLNWSKLLPSTLAADDRMAAFQLATVVFCRCGLPDERRIQQWVRAMVCLCAEKCPPRSLPCFRAVLAGCFAGCRRQ